MPDLSYTQWVFSFVAGFFVGLSKAGIAGLGIVVVPLMAGIFPAAKSVGVLLPMLLCGDVLGVIYYRRHAVWREIGRALPLAFMGIVTGYLFMKYIPIEDIMLKRLIGATVVFMLGLGIWQKWRNKGIMPKMRWPVFIFLGLLGGFTTMTANAAGPVFVIYLLYLGLNKQEFIGTCAWLFLVINFVKVPLQWDLGSITGDSLSFDLCIVPAIILGFYLGLRIVRCLPQNKFELVVKILAGAASIKLILS